MFRSSSYIRNSVLALSAFATFSSTASAALESSSTLSEACARSIPIEAGSIERDLYPSRHDSLVFSIEIPTAGLLRIEATAHHDEIISPRVSFLGRRCAEPETQTGWEVLRAEGGALLVALEAEDRFYFRLTSGASEQEAEEIDLRTTFQAAETWQEHRAWLDARGGSKQARITHFSFGDESSDFFLIAMDGHRAGHSVVRHRAVLLPRFSATGSASWAARVATQTGAPSSVSEPIIVDPDPDTYTGGASSVSEPIIVDPDPDTYTGGASSVSEPIIVDPDPDTLYTGSDTDVTWLLASSELVILDYLLDSFAGDAPDTKPVLAPSSHEREW